MASIQAKEKDEKVVSYKFKACLGRDKDSKQIFKCTTWYPPEGMTAAKIQKAAKIEADIWEREAKQAFLQEQEAAHRAIEDYTFSTCVLRFLASAFVAKVSRLCRFTPFSSI